MNTLRMLGEIDGAMQEVQGYGLEETGDPRLEDVEVKDGKVN
jgi:hypothetical protein